MSSYSEFFLNSKSSIVQLELLEVYHPSFTKTYRIVRNAIAGVSVAHIFGGSTYDYSYYPLRVTSLGAKGDLDAGFRIELGDLGEVLPQELDAVASAGTFSTKPTVTYRTYRSDDLTKPLFGPLVLEVQTFSFKRQGSTFEAKAPSLNNHTTGEIYSFDRFPMLRGFL